jgi:hypothetical protein
MKIKHLKLIGISVALSALLVACGGGGGGGTASSTPASTGTCATASNCALPSSVSGIPPQN